jgi:hypothetical protein
LGHLAAVDRNRLFEWQLRARNGRPIGFIEHTGDQQAAWAFPGEILTTGFPNRQSPY